jgi:hypothetical protein
MDTIRDMLSVGQERNGDWAIYRWDVWPAPRTVATFPRHAQGRIMGATDALDNEPQVRRKDRG